jgi:hypothetical protein
MRLGWGGFIAGDAMTIKLMMMAAIYCVVMLGPQLARIFGRSRTDS